MRKCKHKQTRFTWRVDEDRRWVFVAHCHDCGAAMSLGPSNDVGCEVDIEAAKRLTKLGHPAADIWWDWDGYLMADDDNETNASAYDWGPTRPIAEQGPGAFAQVAAEHATFKAAAERYGDLRLSAANHLANLINTEVDAAITSADAKQAACDAHGYGGKPPIDPSQLVGLSDFVPASLDDCEHPEPLVSDGECVCGAQVDRRGDL